MALDEVGVKFVTEGESQFMNTMQRTVALGVAMGEALYNGAMKAAGAMIDFAKDSISAASDLNETTSKVGVVFDKEAAKVLAFGKTAATSLGMSENAALTAAGTYGNLFRSMGMASDKSADMSVNLVKLAGDLASFNNLDPTEVLEKLRSGLTGEAEPLKSLGININEAAIQAEAMALGLTHAAVNTNQVAAAQLKYNDANAAASKAIGKYGKDSKEAKAAIVKLNNAQAGLNTSLKGQEIPLTAAAKAQAVYSLMLKQTTLAQGDFARTSDGLANQQRILAANTENLKATLGTALLPVVNLVMQAMNKLFSSPVMQKAMEWLTGGIEQLGKIFTNLFNDVSSGSTIFGALVDTFDGMLPDWLLDTLLTLDNIFSSLVGYIQQEGITTFGDFFYALANGFLGISNGTGILQDLGDLLFTIGDTVNSVVAFIQNTIKSFLTTIQAWWAKNGDAIMDTVNTMWSGVKTLFGAAFTFIQTLVNKVLGIIKDLWDKHGDQVLSVVNWLWTAITTIFNAATSILTSLFNAFTDLLEGNWDAFGQHLLDAWNTLWALIKGAAEGAWALLSSWFQTIIVAIVGFFRNTDWGAVGRGIINGIWEAMKSIWGSVSGWVAGAASDVYHRFVDIDWGAVGRSVINGIWGAMQGAWGSFSGWVGSAVSELYRKFTNIDWGAIGRGIINGIWSALSSGWQWLKDQVANLAASLFQAAKRALGIGSPSKAFESIGVNLMLGLEKGILDKINRPVSAMGAVTQMVMAPAQAIVSAGPSSYSYSTANNYNLSVMTNQSPAVIQQSFEMMRLLA